MTWLTGAQLHRLTKDVRAHVTASSRTVWILFEKGSSATRWQLSNLPPGKRLGCFSPSIAVRCPFAPSVRKIHFRVVTPRGRNGNEKLFKGGSPKVLRGDDLPLLRALPLMIRRI